MITRRSFLKSSALAVGAAATALPAGALTPKREKAVLLHSGWATKNIGDVGHTPGTLRFLYQ
ncbi:MAG TPA: twin-arginine translocation signal domain-containing protein, partial [Tepidisphaeraceae bacterium]|nr:twin-arginine translocation signal domain-containing protein [Tepidisphaeraceae bacterium]